jgi:hypothetical protein
MSPQGVCKLALGSPDQATDLALRQAELLPPKFDLSRHCRRY